MYSRIKSVTQNATVKSAHATVAPRSLSEELELDSGDGVGDGDGAGVVGAGVAGDGVLAGLGVMVDAVVGAGVVCASPKLAKDGSTSDSDSGGCRYGCVSANQRAHTKYRNGSVQ